MGHSGFVSLENAPVILPFSYICFSVFIIRADSFVQDCRNYKLGRYAQASLSDYLEHYQYQCFFLSVYHVCVLPMLLLVAARKLTKQFTAISYTHTLSKLEPTHSSRQVRPQNARYKLDRHYLARAQKTCNIRIQLCHFSPQWCLVQAHTVYIAYPRASKLVFQKNCLVQNNQTLLKRRVL